ncbi:MAG TPA: prolyl oligopeptidase family serine peptidase [Saprospiraceae bacterium]|nr:prolyl oligopeptidase family serine peptidase [Saprospiraceae bacterium]
MKNWMLSLFLVLTTGLTLSAQSTVTGKITHDGLQRTYRFYIPLNLKAGQKLPLVFNLHGLGSNGIQQEFYGDFRKIADTAGFFIVHPDGTKHPSLGQNYWNVGVEPSGVDDLGFLEALLDTLSFQYPIDLSKVFCTGMSNGGFMSYFMACNSDRFAAIASVTGSMTTPMLQNCGRSTPIPVMEIHGTADEVVPYDGSSGVESIDEVLKFWTQLNKTPTNPQVIKVLDTNVNDNCTAEHYIYPAYGSSASVEHFKIIGGGHTWPGAIINIGVTNQDISASKEIWRFFSQTKKTTAIHQTTGLQNLAVQYSADASQVTIVPENSESRFVVSCHDLQGREYFSRQLNGQSTLDLFELLPGNYYLQIRSANQFKIFRFFKQ